MRNRWLVLFAAVCVGFSASAVTKRPAIVPSYAGAEIGKWTMDHDAALAKAREGTNNVVVMFNGAWWCPHCQALESTVLTQPAWQAYVETNHLYLVMMDNPGRADQYWCWLRETNYLESVGLTMEQGEAEITNHYVTQTSYAVPGAPTNTVKGVSYLRVGYPTLIVLRPDGSRLGRFSPLMTTVSMDMVLKNMNQLLAADAWDETDDYYQTATPLETPLCEDAETSAGTHTLSDADAADWYSFEATSGVQWAFAFTPSEVGATAEIKAQVFDNPTNSVTVVEKTLTPSDLSVMSFVVPRTGRYWLKVSRAQNLAGLLGYKLGYWYEMAPAVAFFTSARVTVSDRAPSVTLTVAVTGAVNAAEVHVGYETIAGSASPGEDYVPTTGELIWGPGPKLQKTITVPLLPDRITVWEGDETFDVRLFSIKNCSLSSELSSSTVLITESAPRQPGKLGFEGPASATLTEGLTALFSVARTGGANGVVTARVDHVQGAVREKVAQLVWANGETEAKTFEFVFPPEAGFQPDRKTSLQLVPQGGATLVSSARGVLSLIRRDSLVVMPFADFTANPANQAFGFKVARGFWFFGNLSDGERGESWLRSGPINAGDTAVLTSTLAGPGLLTFGWRMAGAGATLQCQLGSQLVASLTDSKTLDLLTVAIPSGRQTVTWTMKGGAGTADGYAALNQLSWTPLPQAAGPAPYDKAVVIDRDVQLSWRDVLDAIELPDGVAKRYEVYAGLTAASLAKLSEQPKAGYPQADNAEDLQAFSNLVAQANARSIYWRVDAVVTDQSGRRAVCKGQTWSLTVLPEGSPEFVKSEGGYDPCAPGGVVMPEQTIGVYGEVGPFAISAAAGDVIRPVVKNGKLPMGMTLEVRDGALWIKGVPTQTGAGFADMQVSVQRTVGARSVTVRGTSLIAVWTVSPLGRAAGQFDGYIVKEGLPGCGNAALTVSAAGAVSGKFVYGGLPYSFSAPSFGGCTNAGYFAKTVAQSGTNRMAVTAEVWEDGAAAEITFGSTEECYFTLKRNNWLDAGMAALLKTYTGYYTLALPVAEASSKSAPLGTGYLTVTVKANGTVTYAGLLADGKSVNGSTVLLYGPDCCSMSDRATFYLFIQPSGYGKQGVLCGHIYLDPGEDALSPKDNTLTVADGTRVLWVNPDPKSVFGYNPTTGALPDGISGFTNELDVTGGYYDTAVNLQTFYPGGTIQLGVGFGAPADFDGVQGVSGYGLASVPVPALLPVSVTGPFGLAFPASVFVKNGTLIDLDASVNPWSMTVNPVRTSGLFSGSFKVYYQGIDSLGKPQQKTKLITYKGVFLPVRSVYQRYAGWMGFYLIPDACKYLGATGNQQSYPFSWSLDFRMAEDPAEAD